MAASISAMLLMAGVYHSVLAGCNRYLSAAALKFLATPQTGTLPTGFFQNEAYGNRATNYG